jgi:hypothetical protein
MATHRISPDPFPFTYRQAQIMVSNQSLIKRELVDVAIGIMLGVSQNGMIAFAMALDPQWIGSKAKDLHCCEEV